MGIASDFVLIVLAGLAGGMLARLLRLPVLVGYVLAGVVVGPYSAGPTVGQIKDIELLAEIGVALLLFSLGLEISFRDLLPVKRIALVGGPVQILVVGALGAAAAHFALGLPWPEAVWCGAMLSLSSTMVVLKTLSEKGVLSTLASRVMIGLLVVQDLAVIPMLVVLPQLNATEGLGRKLALALGAAALVLFSVHFLGTRLLPRLLEKILLWGGRELFLVAIVATGIGVGTLTHSFGISFALGAFVAGLILSESEFSHQALSDVIPLRDIFGLLFFVTVGMLFDPRYAIEHAGKVVIILIVIFAAKSLIFGLISRAAGYVNMAPWIIGLGLSQIGEFSFVLARTGLAGNYLQRETYNLVLTITILTMALAPSVASLALPLGRAWRRWRKTEEPVQTMDIYIEQIAAHVILGGYGRAGKAVAQALDEAAIPYVIVEANYSIAADLRQHNQHVIWGDLTRPEILNAAHIGQAHSLVLTMPDPDVVELAVTEARLLNPSLPIVARAARPHHLAHLKHLGVTAAIQPEFEGGVSMVRATLRSMNHDTHSIRKILERTRAAIYREAISNGE
ncbi:MAG: cation:proton antiporter [Bryobacter sp.]